MKLLAELLHKDQAGESTHDFGTDILPSVVGRHRVVAYRFGGTSGRVTADNYWRDVGTIDAYYEANMDRLQPVPAMDLYQGDWAIRTYEGQHPPARSVPGRSGPAGEQIGFDRARDAVRFTVSDRGIVVIGKGYRFGGASAGAPV